MVTLTLRPYISHTLLSCHLQVLKYTPSEETGEVPPFDCPGETFDYCALGGTFDMIHAGHKVLLGAGIALSSKSLTIGVTDRAMNKSELAIAFRVFGNILTQQIFYSKLLR